jgi:hypothetical protein
MRERLRGRRILGTARQRAKSGGETDREIEKQ